MPNKNLSKAIRVKNFIGGFLLTSLLLTVVQFVYQNLVICQGAYRDILTSSDEISSMFNTTTALVNEFYYRKLLEEDILTDTNVFTDVLFVKSREVNASETRKKVLSKTLHDLMAKDSIRSQVLFSSLAKEIRTVETSINATSPKKFYQMRLNELMPLFANSLGTLPLTSRPQQHQRLLHPEELLPLGLSLLQQSVL